MRRFFFSISLTLALAFISSHARAAAMVVIDSLNHPLSVGTIIDGKLPLEIGERQRLKLLSADGSAFSLEGPSNEAPDPRELDDDLTFIDSIVRITTTDFENSNRIGAYRKWSDAKDPWPVEFNVEQGGNFCLKWATKPIFIRKRPVFPKPEDATLTNKRTQQSGDLSWSKRQNDTLWPLGLPFHSGDKYLLSYNYKPTEFIFRWIPREISQTAHQAAWMEQNDCFEQARNLLDTLR